MLPWKKQPKAEAIMTSAELSAHLSSGPMAASGVNVSERAMIGLPAFYSGVRLISETVAMLPFKLMLRLQDGGARPAYDHPQYGLTMVAANKYQTPFEFFSLMQSRLCVRHNAAAFKELDRGGHIKSLMPIHPYRLSARFSERTGVVLYDIRDDDGTVESSIPADRIFHVQGFSENGFLGWAPIAFLRDAFGGVIAPERYSQRTMANGAHIPGFMRIPMTLPEARIREFKEEFRQHQGVDNAGSVPVFSGDGGGGLVEWVKMGMTAREAEIIETRKFGIADVGRILRIAGHYLNLQDNQPRANREAEGREFLTLTIQPWLTAWAQRFTLSCLSSVERGRGYYYQHVTAALVQANIQERYDAYAKADWMTANEKRALEDMASIEGGDRIYPPQGIPTPQEVNNG